MNVETLVTPLLDEGIKAVSGKGASLAKDLLAEAKAFAMKDSTGLPNEVVESVFSKLERQAAVFLESKEAEKLTREGLFKAVEFALDKSLSQGATDYGDIAQAITHRQRVVAFMAVTKKAHEQAEAFGAAASFLDRFLQSAKHVGLKLLPILLVALRPV